MLLVDQVELLRENLVQLRNQQVSLPLMGGPSATRQTYQFKSLVHPARDIATTIAQADPRGDKLPVRLRGWNLVATDGFSNVKRVHLKKLLGMIIHVYYLSVGNGNLDVSNDSGKRVIVPYEVFLDAVERLVLAPEDACLVICGLAEEQLANKKAVEALTDMTPGSGDLAHCLATIRRWPELHENIWSMSFAHRATAVERDCQTIDDKPFLMGIRHTSTRVLWRIGWRRHDAYAVSWIDISQLIKILQEYFGSRSCRA